MGKICAGVKVLVSIRLEEDGSCCKERCIGHDGKRLGHIRDTEYRGGRKDALKFIEHILLQRSPVPVRSSW